MLEVSESFDLPIQETDFLSTGNSNSIFAYPKIKTIAFSDDILNERLNSDLIQVDDGHIIAFRVEEHNTPAQKQLSDVSDEIKNVLSVQKAAQQATKKGSELFLKLKEGKSLESLAQDNSLEVVSHGPIRRDDNRVPFQISEKVFAMSKPVEGKTNADGIGLADGGYALVELSNVSYGSEEVDETKVQQLSQRVNYGRREFFFCYRSYSSQW